MLNSNYGPSLHQFEENLAQRGPYSDHSIMVYCTFLFRYAPYPYSVPVEHAHEKLLLRAYVERIEISNGGEVVATHPRCWEREQDILNPYHYLSLLAKRPRAFTHAQVVRQWQASWPPVFDTYHAALKQRLDMPEATSRFIAILQLCRTYPEAMLAEALQQALKSYCFTLADVQELVRRLAEPAPPTPIGLAHKPNLARISVTLPDLQQFNRLLNYHEGGA